MISEALIFTGLLRDEQFARAALPYLKKEYFTTQAERAVFALISAFFYKYNKAPTALVLTTEIDKLNNINQVLYQETTSLVQKINEPSDQDIPPTQWLIDSTEEFCKEKALYNAINESIEIFSDGSNDKRLMRTGIPDLMRSALAVSFDTRIGHDFFADAEHQYKYYTDPATKVPFFQSKYNAITDGGVEPKTINMVIAPTHGGKSMFLCDLAAGYLLTGVNVLYITLEMSEETTRKRIDANLLGVPTDDLKELGKERYLQKVQQIKRTCNSNLVVRQFPTAGASAANIRFLLNELKTKKDFVPKVLIIDYLGLLKSERYSQMKGLYEYNKSISEEIRGLAVEYDLAAWTAVQLNREGSRSSDPEATDVADSYGIVFTADLGLVIINTDELRQNNQIMIKQIKNRYKDLNSKKAFLMGLDMPRMKLYDIDESVTVVDSGPVFDKSKSGTKIKNERKAFLNQEDELVF